MITTTNLSILFGSQILFKDVSIKFVEENCYGLIGANGSGKSTFLNALAGEIDISSGNIHLPKGKRIATLRQDHFAFDEYTVMQTALMGHQELYKILTEMALLEAKTELTDDEGMRMAGVGGPKPDNPSDFDLFPDKMQDEVINTRDLIYQLN